MFGIGERDITLTADTLTNEQRADLTGLARDRRRRPPKRQRDAERQAEAEAVAAFLSAQGWRDYDNGTQGQCACGYIGSSFVARPILGDRGGPLRVSCRSCASKGA
jgi:hypothetical protein